MARKVLLAPGNRAILAALALLLLVPRLGTAASCTASTTSVSFGVYDASSTTPNDSTGSLTVTCTYTGGKVVDVLYTVALISSNSPSPATRQLVAGSFFLDYNLYRDAARTEIWGNGTSGSFVVTGSLKPGPGVGNNTRSATHTVYGRMPALQSAAVGSYADTIIVALTF